jgi:hypothetical protein
VFGRGRAQRRDGLFEVGEGGVEQRTAVGVGQQGRTAQLTGPCLQRRGVRTEGLEMLSLGLMLVGNAALRRWMGLFGLET